MPLIRRGIAWESDRQYKFRNPEVPDGETLEDGMFVNSMFDFINKQYFIDIFFTVLKNKTIKPKDWIKNLWELDTEDEENNGLLNEDLIVWMRTAAFPNFRKLYRKINHTDAFENGMPKGNYTIEIEYSK